MAVEVDGGCSTALIKQNERCSVPSWRWPTYYTTSENLEPGTWDLITREVPLGFFVFFFLQLTFQVSFSQLADGDCRWGSIAFTYRNSTNGGRGE